MSEKNSYSNGLAETIIPTQKGMTEKTCRLFVIEDHEIMRETLQLLIRRLPALEWVGEAGDGYEALERLAETPADVALVDISLPGMNGIELIRHLKSQFPAMKTLIVSGHEEELYVRQALSAGAHGYLQKTHLFDALETAVKTVMSGKTYVGETGRRMMP